MKRIIVTTVLTAAFTVLGAAPALAGGPGPEPWETEEYFPSPGGFQSAEQGPMNVSPGPLDFTDTPKDDEPPFPPDGPEDDPSPDEPAVPETEDGPSAGSAPVESAASAAESTESTAGDAQRTDNAQTADNAQAADIVEADESGEQGTAADSILLIAVGCLAGLLAACAAALVRERRARKA